MTTYNISTEEGEVEVKLRAIRKTTVLVKDLTSVVEQGMKTTHRTYDENGSLYELADTVDYETGSSLADAVNASWKTRPCSALCNYPYDERNPVEVVEGETDGEHAYCSDTCSESSYY